MSYEFKRLGEVNALGEMKEGLNVLAVDGSEVAKIAADEIINASVNKAMENILDAEVIEEASETATVLVEDNGVMNKVPVSEVGGSKVKNLIITVGDSSMTANMTYEEFSSCLTNNEIRNIMVYFGNSILYSTGIVNHGNCFEFAFINTTSEYQYMPLYFLSDNTISDNDPNAVE